jgi:hypothetical protein
MIHTRYRRLAVAGVLAWATSFLVSCAATSEYDDYGPAPIPQGKGRLIIEAGGIPRLNFYIIDEQTEDEVYSDMPLQAAFSPSAFQSSQVETNLRVDLDPGIYRVVVNTHIDDDVELSDVEIRMGQETLKVVRVGRFQVIMNGANSGSRLPFVIMDYNMSNILGRAMTTPDVRHLIVPEGHYKIRIENSTSGLDVQRPLEVSFGRITPIQIGVSATEEGDEGDDQ